MASKKISTEKWTQRFLVIFARYFGKWFVRALHLTLDFEIQGFETVEKYLREGRAVIIPLWHGDMFLSWTTLGHLKPAVIVSLHGDGDLASALVTSMGFNTFRGSSNKGGREAYTQMIRYLKKQDKQIAVFASDGPKGPRRVMKSGTLATARLLRGVIIPISCSASDVWRAEKSWDKFTIPKPFSRARVVFGKAIEVPVKMSNEEQKIFLKEVSETHLKQQETLEKELGHHPI